MPFHCTLVDFLHIYIERISTLLNLEKMSHDNITCSPLREYIYQTPLPLVYDASPWTPSWRQIREHSRSRDTAKQRLRSNQASHRFVVNSTMAGLAWVVTYLTFLVVWWLSISYRPIRTILPACNAQYRWRYKGLHFTSFSSMTQCRQYVGLWAKLQNILWSVAKTCRSRGRDSFRRSSRVFDGGAS